MPTDAIAPPTPLQELERRAELALHAGSERSVQRQHDRGKLLARERIDLLLDQGSFVELDRFARHRAHGFGLEEDRPYGDGVVTGHGTVNGRRVFVFSQDFTVFGGSLGEVDVRDAAALVKRSLRGVFRLSNPRDIHFEHGSFD